MRVVLSLVLLVSMALAGCAGDPAASEDELLEQAVEAGVASDVPAWSVGQYWTYKMTAGEYEIGTASLVVTADDGTDYIVGSNDKGIAYFDAAFDITFMGEVRKSDLAGSQGSERVSMFDWPLVADKEWTTTWDGQTLDMYANPMGEPGQFHVMGHRQGDGAMTVEYHYNPDVAWFEYIKFYDADNGTVGFQMELTDHGDLFSGTVYEYELMPAETFVIDDEDRTLQVEKSWPEATELGLVWKADCNGDSAGQILMAMSEREEGPAHMPPIGTNPPYGAEVDCQQGDVVAAYQVAANAGETWAIDMAMLSPAGSGSLYLEPRILTEIPF